MTIRCLHIAEPVKELLCANSRHNLRHLLHSFSNLSVRPERSFYSVASRYSTPNRNFIFGQLAGLTSEDRVMSLYFQPALSAAAMQATQTTAGMSTSEAVYLGGTGHVSMTEDGTLINWSRTSDAPPTVSTAISEITAVERIPSKGRSAHFKIATQINSLVVEIPRRARLGPNRLMHVGNS